MEHIRQPCVIFSQKGSFVSKKVVQFQNGKVSEKTSQGIGSIPEWNPEILLLIVDWFNSLVDSQNLFTQSQLGHVPYEENTTKRKRKTGGGVY